ncbi:Stp1/IreP family PP2C-type Ser/Thr phosphatase [Terrilactibacillus sp. BCM23-1]|uniref:protein-serine/threonine phosphatase n=1 Tax=Terrilactibacillus tamarindi TaxID=2599694 RepID=A0A6N8CQ50_9BACI|nr:Stp1/IreP family PP2C-type Ser/Thr phosphatase [Terrilactibacillus tamarindi]MTT32319.1 Stp1/IreP family PP2C-type Ser/Thr phosphatase [Terrilactibacillus tamarindi]
MKAIFNTDQGKVRGRNEDSGGIFLSDDQLLAVVADGMGGHQAGDVASQMTLDYFEKKWQEISHPFTKADGAKWLKGVVQEINQTIYEFAQEHPECKGMGTTVVAAICQNDAIFICYVGDSRIYIYDGDLKQVTEDHTLVNELVKSGQLTKENAENHPNKHILLRALGTEPQVNSDALTIEWSKQAQLLLCSDGLTNKLSDERLKDILSLDETLEMKSELMIKEANEAGGEDNITLVLIANDDGDLT